MLDLVGLSDRPLGTAAVVIGGWVVKLVELVVVDGGKEAEGGGEFESSTQISSGWWM